VYNNNNKNNNKSLPSTLEYDTCTNIIIEYLYTNSTNLQIACGAKFGCDYLLYDGPRNKRHAFAGLRIIPFQVLNDNNRQQEQRQHQQQHQYQEQQEEMDSHKVDNSMTTKEHDDSIVISAMEQNEEAPKTSKQCSLHFPVPSPFDLSGYVRCLNTAGKLALLATVVPTNAVIEKTMDGPKNKTAATHRIAIIDLALEKIVATTVNRPKKTLEDRLKLLSKT
jgi:hypothetical protein